jgi:hypothetical protein
MSTPITSKLLLVADRRTASSEPSTVPVRRYRLARLRLEGRPADPATRFEHIKRVFD